MKYLIKLLSEQKNSILLIFFISLMHLITGISLARSKYLFGKNPFLPVFLAFSAGLLFTFFEDYFSHPIAERINRKLTGYSYLKFLTQPFTKSNLKNLSYEISNSSWTSEAAFSLLRSLFRRGLQIGGFTLYLLWIDWRLFLILALTSPLVFLPGWFMGIKSSKYRQQIFKDDSYLKEFYSQSDSNLATIKAYEKEKYFNTHHLELLKKIETTKTKHRRFESFNKPVSLLGMVISFSLVFFISAYFLENNTLTNTTRFSFFTVMALLYSPLSGLSHDLLLIKSIQKQDLSYLKNIFKYNQDTEFIKKTSIKSKIYLKNIEFSYNSKKPVIQNFSAKFETNKIYLLQGSNGSGKTTLIHLIQGLLQPQSGKIILDEKQKKNRG